MKRIKIAPRDNYQQIVQEQGFNFEANYWLENAYYQFTAKEIEELEKATNVCYEMFIMAVQHVIDNNLWHKLHIPAEMIPVIIDSWDNDELSLYGRFDFAMIN